MPDIVFSSTPLRKAVQFDQSISIPPTATSTSFLISSSSSSLSFPLAVEKPGIRFKLVILLLSLFLALLVGFLLSLILVTQVIQIPNRRIIPLVTHVPIDHSGWNTNICEDFYGFICGKWLIDHPLSTLDFKRSWLTERSKDIREKFARILANFSDTHVEHYQTDMNNNQTDEIDDDGYSSTKNEFVRLHILFILSSRLSRLEQFYSFHDNYDENPHKLIKRQLNSPSNNFSHSLSNMFLFYHQCLHTSQTHLLDQLHTSLSEHFSFTSDHHFDILFEQMLAHPLMHLWNTNSINLGTQTIIHIERQIQNQEKIFLLHQMEQAILFEEYLHHHQIHLCSLSSLSKTLKDYQELILTSLTFSNASIHDDLDRLLNNDHSLPIIYSAIKRSNELKDFIQILFDKELIDSSDQPELVQFFANFTSDLKIHLANTPIFRSTIAYQCQLYLKYYIAIRSFTTFPKLQQWFDYISSSILQIILHSWPGDASYTCLYSTIVRHHQFEKISYWNQLIDYTKRQMDVNSSPMVTVEIRLIDFFQLDSIFRFLFADQYAHFCHLMVYKYGPKLLPFLSVFDQDIEIDLKHLWKQTMIENAKEQSSKDLIILLVLTIFFFFDRSAFLSISIPSYSK